MVRKIKVTPNRNVYNLWFLKKGKEVQLKRFSKESLRTRAKVMTFFTKTVNPDN